MKFMFSMVIAGVLMQPVQAQEFPSKPIRIIVPTSPGGGSDVLARIFSPGLAKEVKQPVLVENRPGGGGLSGMDFVAKAEPDGYILLMGASNLASVRLFNRSVPFDPLTDLSSISALVEYGAALGSPADAPWKNFGEMVAHARANPGKLSYGHLGSGLGYLYTEMIKNQLKLDILPVAYKSGADYILATLKNEVQMSWPNLGNAVSQAKAGKMKVLGVTGDRRAPELPDVPAFSELGIRNMDNSYFSLMGPGRLTKPLIDRIYRYSSAAMNSPEVREASTRAGFSVLANKPEELQKTLETQSRTWAQAAKIAGIQPE